MSKAFTREDDVTEETELPLRPRAPAGQKRPITPEGYQAIQQELASLPRDQTRRIQQLTEVLEDVEVVDHLVGEGTVGFGSWVTVEDEDGNETTYRLVGPDEADVRAGRLNAEAPLARALMGRSVDETITFERPRGAVEFTITSVSSTAPVH